MKIRLAFKVWMFVLLTIGVSGCKQIRKVADVLVKPTAREVYARDFEKLNTERFRLWENEFEKAKEDRLQVFLPYLEIGKNFPQRNMVHSYNLNLEEGSVLHVKVKNEARGSQVFIDVLKMTSDSTYKQLTQNDINKNALQTVIEASGSFKVLIQPELNAEGDFEIEIFATPSYSFPVIGKSHEAIQSFWGASRDSGARSHEGIDIFAERGTPVIAVTNGRISSTGNRGLGGKQVWLRTGVFGKSLYYAHLDTIISKIGDKVYTGDTLGLVGNTGNAKTTQPHLHFGIYKSGEGAIDPLPFVQQTKLPERKSVNTIIPQIKVSATKANLRNAPSLKSIVIGEAIENDTLQLLGYTNIWAHVLSSNGKKAFVHSSLIVAP